MRVENRGNSLDSVGLEANLGPRPLRMELLVVETCMWGGVRKQASSRKTEIGLRKKIVFTVVVAGKVEIRAKWLQGLWLAMCQIF